ncbi:MAG: hypothetical protein AABY53_00695 [Bdellovibrionota bacterium]
MNQIQNQWRKCSSCKKEINLNTKYYECNVSTCTGLRTGYVFCSVSCWEVHLPGAKHRNAGAIEKRSPTTFSPEESAAPKRIIISSGVPSAPAAQKKSPMSSEVLVVVSKMKQYIRDIGEMNTSEDVNQLISDMIRSECEKAILNARADGRKTVMARDFDRRS